MKPRNFPDRANERRKRAFEKMKPSDAAYDSTAAKISMSSLRGVKTKKDNRSKAKFRGI
jgi:hypothetical protein